MTAISNVPELSVSELSFALKKTLEDGFSRVRVRGELSKVKIHSSGHMYSDLKDADCLINLVCWKGTVARLSVRPEEGLEVICTGRITTYPSRSNYQLVVEQIELAGEGALLKMLEDRRRKLAAEGLFDGDRKRKLPFLPQTIGVVTSPTGSVIRDILHRLEDRFPRHVLVWPVKVQGAGAAEEIAAAITGFNTMPMDGAVPRPDLVIVARGGGSLEDLMPFNEEIVVRAAANCTIPLISAVGHETDTTLIDFASDHRAPTPSAAAERAVPERMGLLNWVGELRHRLSTSVTRSMRAHAQDVAALSAHLKDPMRLLETKTQTLDRLSDKLTYSLDRQVQTKSRNLQETASGLKDPKLLLDGKAQTLDRLQDKLSHLIDRQIQAKGQGLQKIAAQLHHPKQRVEREEQKLEFHLAHLERLKPRLFDRPENRLDNAGKMLELLSFKNVLKRGFAVVYDEYGELVPTRAAAEKADALKIEFADGELPVQKSFVK